MEKDDQIEQFLTLCESSPFPHRDELVRGIGAGEYIFERSSTSDVPSQSLLDIYGVRAQILADRILSKELRGAHAERLLSDTKTFVGELEMLSDERINFFNR